MGGIPIKLGINLKNNGEVRETQQLANVVPCIVQPLVNKSALCNLGLLPNLWPPRCVETGIMPMKYNEERVQLSTELETKADCMLELRPRRMKNIRAFKTIHINDGIKGNDLVEDMKGLPLSSIESNICRRLK